MFSDAPDCRRSCVFCSWNSGDVLNLGIDSHNDEVLCAVALAPSMLGGPVTAGLVSNELNGIHVTLRVTKFNQSIAYVTTYKGPATTPSSVALGMDKTAG